MAAVMIYAVALTVLGIVALGRTQTLIRFGSTTTPVARVQREAVACGGDAGGALIVASSTQTSRLSLLAHGGHRLLNAVRIGRRTCGDALSTTKLKRIWRV